MCVHKDPASFANSDEVVVKHIDLDWKVDFQNTKLVGNALLTLEALKPTNRVILDSRDLEIKSVLNCEHKIIDHGPLGKEVFITLDRILAPGEKYFLHIKYATSKNASALQFVDTSLTADKKQPFLYSQCQAIHARSIVPCMDTPAVKQTYAARVSVPHGVTCLMSAIGYGNDKDANPQASEWMKDSEYKKGFAGFDLSRRQFIPDHDVFLFRQTQPIPSYLFAIVAGSLEKRDISDRCAVWAEASMVERAHREFADTEVMLKTAEDLLGPYVWGRYDLIVLPPFFPFGGMENPCLTFVTPTIIAGDRSLTNVIAHEIAHSWTGNLVTNATWEHFWLNEGFTVFCERKIMGRIYGEKMRQFDNVCGWEDRMMPAINETFHSSHEFTKLCPNLKGIDPDDAYSTIPYEKGSGLLLFLEEKLEDVPRFEKFLKDYIAHFAGKSIVTQDWKDYLFEYFPDKKDVLEKINWKGWLYEPGHPPNTPYFEEELVTECRAIAKVWLFGNDDDVDALTAEQFNALTSDMKVKVLDCIETYKRSLSHDRIMKMEDKYKLTKSGNCEVRFSFALICLKAKLNEMLPFILNFATSQGRLKYVKPIFKKLFAWEDTRDLAIFTFESNIPYMHPITAQVVRQMI